MPSEYTDKLIKLIQTSPILTPVERSEWLALLDLMNQKQLAELEAILITEQKPKSQPVSPISPPAALRQTFPPKPAAPQLAAQPKPAVVKPHETQIPQLSHITNVPNFGSHLAAKPAFALAQKPAQAAPPQEKKTSTFSDKLKFLVTEKELPSGKHNNPAPVTQPPVIKPQPAVPSLNLKTQPPAQKPPQTYQPLAHTQAPAGLNNRPTIINPHLGGASMQRQPAAEPGSKVDFGAIDQKIQAEVMAAMKGGRGGTDNSPKILSSTTALEDLGDLTLLSNKALENNDFDFLVSKVRGLVKGYGYFEVIFNLEKSPLYKNYIKTGLELLTKESGFEQLYGGTQDFLTRQQFEKLVDLLRQIQVG